MKIDKSFDNIQGLLQLKSKRRKRSSDIRDSLINIDNHFFFTFMTYRSVPYCTRPFKNDVTGLGEEGVWRIVDKEWQGGKGILTDVDLTTKKLWFVFFYFILLVSNSFKKKTLNQMWVCVCE